jgi:hypothetical protein
MPTPCTLPTSKRDFTFQLLTWDCSDYDYELQAEGGMPNSSVSEAFSRYVEYIRQELPRLLQQRLEREVEEELRNRVPDMVGEIYDELLQSFRLSQGIPDTTPDESSVDLTLIPVLDETETEIGPTVWAQDHLAAPLDPPSAFDYPALSDMGWLDDFPDVNLGWELLQGFQRSQALQLPHRRSHLRI